MFGMELVCLAIVAFYLGSRLVRLSSRRERLGLLGRFGALSMGAAAGESSMIRLYGAYHYASSWSVFVDCVPLVVVLIWPVVIDSAAMLARRLTSDASARTSRSLLRVSLVTAAIVLADASLIEPIAVRAGLWVWSEPGLFDVPLYGIAGWAIFSGLAIALLERGLTGPMVVLAPVGTHFVIQLLYWSVFRWVRGVAPPAATVATAWIVLTAAAFLAWRVGRRVPLVDVMLRAPGAIFFFVLLAFLPDEGGARSWLIAYAGAFAAPYLALIVSRARAYFTRDRRGPTPNEAT